MVGANFALNYTCNTCTLLFFPPPTVWLRAAAVGLQLLLLWTTIMAFHVLNSCVFLFFFLRITTVNFSLTRLRDVAPKIFLHTIFLYIISNKFIKIWCCVLYEMKMMPCQVTPSPGQLCVSLARVCFYTSCFGSCWRTWNTEFRIGKAVFFITVEAKREVKSL